MFLKEYKRKRNFRRTPEPAGKRRAEGSGLVYVVQKHDASHLHYDLRLEYRGVLKSWAVPKGIPLESGARRLAIETEDHPMEYRDFEGVIPEPDYGAGTVMVWDSGRYYVDENLSLEENRRQTQEGLSRGRLSFVLEGEKIKGAYTLVKMKKSGQKPQWLLLRRQGAQPPGRYSDVSVKTGRTMEEIAGGAPAPKKKDDISILFKPEDFHLSEQGPMPQNVAPMLAVLVDEPFDGKDWIFELKWDGYRCLAEIRQGEVRLYSRNNKTQNERFPAVAKAFSDFPADALFDGEIVAVDEKGASRFQLLQNYLNGGRGALIYYVFDILYLGTNDLRKLPLARRKEILRGVLPSSAVVRFSDYVESNGRAFFDIVQKNGLEGVVAKKLDSPYRSGSRSREWLKVKALRVQEAVIGGFTRPKGGSRKFFSALLLGVYDGARLRFIGHTGGGFSEQSLKDIHGRLEKLAQENCPFEKAPVTNAAAVWVRPELVCQVKFLEWTAEGFMRQPVFLGLREDARPQDTRRESPQSVGETLSRRPELTHLDKIFWPREGYTKKDLIEYYQDIAGVILPYLKDRPQSLNRFPDGIEGENFFQKNVDSMPPEWVSTASFRSESRSSAIRYLLCQDKESLAYLNNLGCIELNVWNSTIQNPRNPDYLVFDLDPVDVDFEDVVRVALEIKDFLDHVELTAFCKTSGGRGLHIYVPLRHAYSFEQVREFARIASFLIHARMPRLTSLERNPGRRKGRVYLDYLQNRYASTMASAYSLRPRPGATVSSPLEWKELDSGLRPEAFTIRSMRRRLDKKGDIWKGLLEGGADLKKSLELMEKKFSWDFP
ncbi:MAG: DNA ligase D [Candidatus Omnitrophota bacterium]